ncbi:TPA: POTRA domain-containing protein [Pseudomonas aeruginosa]
MIFPSSKGKVLNLRDLEHGLAKSAVNPLPIRAGV